LDGGWGDQSGAAEDEKIAGADCWKTPVNFEMIS
jgi:hypothetical protein